MYAHRSVRGRWLFWGAAAPGFFRSRPAHVARASARHLLFWRQLPLGSRGVEIANPSSICRCAIT